MTQPLDEEAVLRRFFSGLTGDSAENGAVRRTVERIRRHEFAAWPNRSRAVSFGQVAAAVLLVAVAVGLVGWRTLLSHSVAPATKSPTPTASVSVHGRWAQVFTSVSPLARAGFGMTYDARNRVVVLFGGYTGNNAIGPTRALSDTWIWNGTTWSKRETSTSPAARSGASLAFDEATGSTVLFGGGTGPSQLSLLADTWTWDGRLWTIHHPVSSPPARTRGSLTYDPRTRTMILFGGQTDHGWLADTWAWDGTNWTQETSTSMPPARSGASLEYDETRGSLILTGGLSAGGLLGDTWWWEGKTWTRLEPVSQPPGRFGSSLVRYSRTHLLLLFGGSPCMSGGCGPNETWAWTGVTWTQVPSALSPPYRYEAGLALNPTLDSVVLFGGRNGSDFLQDTWVWSVQ